MAEQIEKKHLSETIDYDRDIAPYRFIKIYSGVGSGKNRFIDRLVQGDYFKHADGSYVKKQHVLLVTSRRSKVDEQLNSKDTVYDPNIGIFDGCAWNWLMDDPKYQDYFESPRKTLENSDGWGESTIYCRSCAYTNAKIETNLKLHYSKSERASHPWACFDMIIVDEAHSLLADASYQSAPFYVRRLIEETLKRSTTCKVIVMTGTPEILKDYPLLNEAHLIDRMEECINVTPQAIEFITQKEAGELRAEMIQKGQKFVAFFNRAEDVIKEGRKHFEVAAISFSDSKKRTQLKSDDKQLFEKMKHVEDYIAENERLPDDLLALLCTSKHKEGINIKNEDISAVFIEAHAKNDVLQMAGRVRTPVPKLYLIANSIPHPDKEKAFESEFSEREDVLAAVNLYFQDKCREYGYPLFDKDAWCKPVHCVEETGAVIDYLHEKFPCIRFDYFTQRFVYYPEHALSKAYHKAQNAKFKAAANTEGGLIALVQEWYPGIPCTVSRKMKQLMFAENKAAMDNYLSENHWLNGARPIHQEERQQICADLTQLLGMPENTRLGPLLKRYKYNLIKQTNSNNRMAPWKIEPSEA